jgi:hypothetical protein
MRWFDEKRNLIELLFLVSAGALVFAIAIMFMPKKGNVVRYDCSIAEISPDIPLEVKEKCRKLRAEKL